jgi:hypothetical protein
MGAHASPGVALRRAGVEATAVGDRRRVETAIAVALGGGIAFQVFQRLVNNGYEVGPYGRSLWYVSYQFGFVRRGLAGELLRRLVGHSPTVVQTELAQNAIAAVTVAAAALLVVALCRRRTVVTYALAAALVASPFGFDFVGGSHRPDLVDFLLLAGLGLWAARPSSEPMAVALVGGIVLGVSAFFSEAGPLVVGPWLVLVVVCLARARRRSAWECGVAMTVAAVPSLLALGALAVAGRATPDQLASFEVVAPLDVGGKGTVFPYMDDTLGISFAKVIDRRPLLSFVVGAVLLTMAWFLVRRAVPYLRRVFAWLMPGRAMRLAWIAGTVGCTGALFALGFDWMRWITSVAFSATLATGAILLIVGPLGDEGPEGGAAWHRPIPSRVAMSLPALVSVVVAIYLLVLPPLPTAVTTVEQMARLLVNAPG